MRDNPPFDLPAETTDEGAMARLFINEAAGPHNDPSITLQAMGWMKRVLVNCAQHPREFDAAGSTLTQIIQAPSHAVQFAGFNNYPRIGAGVKRNIEAKLTIAADKHDPRQKRYLAFVQAAISAAAMPAPLDPCPTGLFFWKTHGSVSPGGKAIIYQALDGNDFYTLPADFFSPKPKEHHVASHRAHAHHRH